MRATFRDSSRKCTGQSEPLQQSMCRRIVLLSEQEARMADPKKPQEKSEEKYGEDQDNALDEPWDHPDQEPEKHPNLEKLRESEE
jgi:hypothetical protein